MYEARFIKDEHGLYTNARSIRKTFPGKCLSKSLLLCAEHSHKKLLDYLENKIEPNRFTVFGNAVHTSILEPDKFQKRFRPAHFTNTKQNPFARLDTYYHDLSHAIIMKDIFANSPQSFMLSPEYLKERAFFYKLALKINDKNYVFGVKGVVDIIRIDSASQTAEVYDIKSTSSVEASKIAQGSKNYGYDMQHYIYAKFCEVHFGLVPKFALIFTKNKYPFEVVEVCLGEDSYISGRNRFFACISKVIDFAEKYNYNKFYAS